jgi:predicted DNA-binding protein (MmcQ/YjbR family)
VLRRFALRFPEAYEDFPWGDRTMKVRGKIFLFLGHDRETLNLSVKLPESAEAALGLPFTSPTRYRLGRSGWVTARFPKGSEIPLDMFRQWIDESYRAVAPATLHPSVSAQGTPPTAPRTRGDTGRRSKLS